MTRDDDAPRDHDDGAHEPTELQTQLTRLTRALRRARGHGNQHVDGLSIPQYHLVEPLLRAEVPMPVGALAERAGIAAPTATTMVRKLEKGGLVVRSGDPSDGRVVRFALTDAGREIVRERREIVYAWRRRIAEAVDPSDLEAGARVLSALADAVDLSVDELGAAGHPSRPDPA